MTGASSGIGEATARLLASRGWRCVLVARREDKLRAVAEEIGGEVEVCDVADREAVEATAARVLARHPRVHLLVNNAGIPARGSFLTLDPERIELVMRVNYLGGVWCTRAFLPGLEAVGRRRRASGRGQHRLGGRDGGVCSRGPVCGGEARATGVLAVVWRGVRHRGIGCHAVLPGFLETEGFPQHSVLRSRTLRRFMTDTDAVAKAVVSAVERNRGEVIVPWFPYRLVSLAQALFPTLTSRLAGRFTYHRGEQHV